VYIDACALIAVLADEDESERISRAMMSAKKPFTSPIAVLETALALARPDKFNMSVEALEPLILEFLDARTVELRDLPPARTTTALALAAAHKYRQGRKGLNLGDCLHYACAKYYGAPILATHDEFKQTDLETVS
jgi:ribonuclease VapC